MENKSQLQNKWFNALKDKHRVILRWATGVGKSKMTIDLVNNAVSTLCSQRAALPFEQRPTLLVVVAERSHISNWNDEFQKWILDFRNTDVTIMCYASLHKVKGESFDIIVFDEAHHCFTEKRMDILNTVKAEYIYLLSATLSWQKVSDIESLYGKFTVSTVSLKEAISSDILPDPRVYLIPMELDNHLRNQEILVNTKKRSSSLPEVNWENRANYIYKKIPCVILCTARQKYDYLSSNMEYWKQRYERSHNDFFRNIWVNLGSQRKRFLGDLKTSNVRKLISLFGKNKRFICFCSSVAQADELDAKNTISSKKASKTNQGIIDSFNAKKLHRLFAIGMATEGLNLNDIQAGIIVQLDGKERLFVQKFGRSLRAEDPVAYIFYYKGTQDEKYLKNALENIEEKFIKTLNINNLK